MILRLVILILALATAAPAFAAKPVKASLIITVSLSKNSMTIQKNSRKSRSVLTAWIIPVAAGSIRPGNYKLQRMTDRYKSQDGNVILENVVRTDGEFNIRTTRMFQRWQKSGRPATRAIVLDAETGSLLFTTIRNYGIDKTLLRVIP
jgi:hypothetical protein